MYEIVFDRCQGSIAIVDVPAVQELSRQSISSVAESTDALLIDVIDFQCPDGRCGNTYGGTPIYRDGHHISVRFSAALGELFTARLGDALSE